MNVSHLWALFALTRMVGVRRHGRKWAIFGRRYWEPWTKPSFPERHYTLRPYLCRLSDWCQCKIQFKSKCTSLSGTEPVSRNNNKKSLERSFSSRFDCVYRRVQCLNGRRNDTRNLRENQSTAIKAKTWLIGFLFASNTFFVRFIRGVLSPRTQPATHYTYVYVIVATIGASETENNPTHNKNIAHSHSHRTFFYNCVFLLGLD